MKKDTDGNVKRFKAYLVVKDYAQKSEIDFDEILTGGLSYYYRIVLAITAVMNLELEQIDVKTTFLHSDLEEEIYMVQPEDFVEKDKEKLVYQLNKSLYGLKQTLKCWYK